jgi:hypothetical protein
MADDEETKIPVKAGEFEVGCLYRTNKPFSSRNFEMDAHPRWLLYLGKSGSFDYPVVVYVFSSTTQLYHFIAGGDKENSPYRKYVKGRYGFTEDCVICFDDIIDYLTEKDLEVYEPICIDKFDNDELRNVYNCILKSNKVKQIAKIDIHTNLSKKGIKNLEMPKRRSRY